MWIRTSSVLLATLVVSGLSFPAPDHAAYRIPEVGTGDRSQYYVLHSDGTFKYGFDTGDGAFEAAKSHGDGVQEGKFGYVDPDGRTIRLEYEAGRGGFVARGDHLPKASPELARAIASVIRSEAPFVDPLAGTGSDASYGFGFSSAQHSRNEESDRDGTVTGSYSYVDEDGVTRSFTYRAGKGIGFVIEGDGLTQEVGGLASASRSPTTTSQAAFTRTRAPSRPSFRTSHHAQQTHRPAHVTSGSRPRPGDPSYSFSYNAGDHSRFESSDRNRNIDGGFSFVADDGNRRTINYVAGSGTGFRATGDHLPVAPAVPSVPAAHSTSIYTPSTLYQTPSTSQGASFRASHRSSASPSPSFSSSSSSSRRFEEANIRSSAAPSGAYSFSYDTSSHSRSESGDDANRVTGDFSFVADDDGIRRSLNYEAGSGLGFVVDADHLPVGPVVPGAPAGVATGRKIMTGSKKPFVDPLADSGDASYDFGFESDSYSRSESADADGNVSGTYTVVDDDGTRVTYRFRAGKGVGFETEEVSRSSGPPPPRRAPYTGPLASQTGVQTSAGQTASFRVGGASVHSPTSGQRKFTSATARKVFEPAKPALVKPSTSYVPPPQGAALAKPRPRTSFATPQVHRSSSAPAHSSIVSPDFTLHTYQASPDAHKFGYVINYNE